ncbi:MULTISPECIES: 4'-phosphopantetheinyl transferase family protein [unclassified Aeromicrobium]|uniref:4'-phosphopantetheinyl transferase family protein n=1 Tax=unclassified Aeromicrobium TaxID=2633570 RepID=UPI00396B2599
MAEARRDRLADPLDRAFFTAARALARACVAALLDTEADDVRLVQLCPSCGGVDHGRPSVLGRPEVGVSWAHAGGAVVALATHGPCGVDVEPPIAGPAPQRAITEAERAWLATGGDFTRLWTRKEALVKAGAATLDEAARLDVLADTVRGLDLRTWQVGAATVSSATQPIGSSTNTGIFRSVFFW